MLTICAVPQSNVNSSARPWVSRRRVRAPRPHRTIRTADKGADALLSHVLIALEKCPTSSCAQNDVKSLLRRSATGSGCFGVAAFWRVVLLDFDAPDFDAPDFDAPDFVAGFVAGLGGMVCDVTKSRRCC